MVTVPRIGEGRIQAVPTPAPPPAPVAPLEGFGGGRALAGVSREVQANLQQARQMAVDERVRVRRAKHRDLDDQLVRKATESKTRLASVKGLEAQEEYDAIQKDYEAFHREITKDVTDDRLLEATRNSYLKRSQDLDAYSQKYVLVERRSYEKDKFETHQEGLHESALAFHRSADGSVDTGAISDTIDEREWAIIDYGQGQGWDRTVIENRVRKMESTTHRDVINLMSSKKDDVGANEYLKQFRGQMLQEDIRAIESVVQKSGHLGEVRRRTNEILAMGLDEQASKVEANKIKDPIIHRAVNQSLRTEFSETRRLEKQAQNETFKKWVTVMNRPENQGRQPEGVLDEHGWLDAPESLQQSLNAKLNPPGKNDNLRWLEFLNLSQSGAGQEEIKSWTPLEFHQFSQNLDAAHRVRAEKIWTSQDIQQDVFLTTEQDKVATRFLIDSGFFPQSGNVDDATEEQRQIKEDFVVALERKISDDQLAKKQVNSKVIEAFGNELMADTVQISRNAKGNALFGLFRNARWAWQSALVEKPRFAIPSLVDEPSDILGLNALVTSIPTQDRRDIEEDYRSSTGLTRVPDDVVMRAFRILVQRLPGWRQEYIELTGKEPE